MRNVSALTFLDQRGLSQRGFCRRSLSFSFRAYRVLDPIDEANDFRVEGEMIFSGCNAKKVTPLFIAHRTLQASGKQRQLVLRGHEARGGQRRSSINTGSPFADRLSFIFGTTIYP